MTVELVDRSRPAYDERPYRPVRTTVWQPSGTGPHPIVLLSHGTGGAVADLSWLASALVAAGIAVLGVDHHGNTHVEPYDAEGFARNWDRPRDLTFALDQLADPFDLTRVGAAGFSLGGYTAAALLGARLNTAVLRAIFEGELPAGPLPEFPDLLEHLRKRISDPDEWLAGAADSWRDDRVRAAFLMAPAQGALVEPASLARIDRPVEIRWGDADDNMVPAENALRYLALIPGARGRSVGATVGHYEFIHPNGDGAAVCAEVAADAVEFFREQLCR
jgi:predicted dienelactone hydrolase